MTIKFIVLAKLLRLNQSLLLAGYCFLFFSLFIVIEQYTRSFSSFIFCILLTFCGLTHHYISIRVNFDAKLLDYFAQKSNSKNIENLTAQLDDSLMAFKLMPTTKTNRNWDIRLSNCIKLLKIQFLIFAMQVSLFLITLFLLFLDGS
ncbi:hypothetical protein BFG52_00370 [Acinetobacter larvae]|uniref:Uncharacterized protein n=1 Tax=Acinetobacter larvae TaxID=1789224 RepID=A0A1B2LVK6_9GAMM|nr:hypothetical protein BFG52_00370 [Acinetobacter larvae]